MNLGEYIDKYGNFCICGEKIRHTLIGYTSDSSSSDALRYECVKQHFKFSTEYVSNINKIKNKNELRIMSFTRNIKINEKDFTVSLFDWPDTLAHINIYRFVKDDFSFKAPISIKYPNLDINKWLITDKEFEIMIGKYMLLI